MHPRTIGCLARMVLDVRRCLHGCLPGHMTSPACQTRPSTLNTATILHSHLKASSLNASRCQIKHQRKAHHVQRIRHLRKYTFHTPNYSLGHCRCPHLDPGSLPGPSPSPSILSSTAANSIPHLALITSPSRLIV